MSHNPCRQFIKITLKQSYFYKLSSDPRWSKLEEPSAPTKALDVSRNILDPNTDREPHTSLLNPCDVLPHNVRRHLFF